MHDDVPTILAKITGTTLKNKYTFHPLFPFQCFFRSIFRFVWDSASIIWHECVPLPASCDMVVRSNIDGGERGGEGTDNSSFVLGKVGRESFATLSRVF